MDFKSALKMSQSKGLNWVIEPKYPALYYYNPTTKAVVDYFNNILDLKTLNKLGDRFIGLTSELNIFSYIPKHGLWILMDHNINSENRTRIELVTRANESKFITQSGEYSYIQYSIRVLTPIDVELLVRNMSEFTK